MEKKSVQVNCRMAADSAGRLKELAESAGLSLGAFIEKMLDCYQSDSKVIAGSDGWQSVANDLSNRVLALETRLLALESVGAVRTRAVGKEACSAVLVPVDAEAVIEAGATVGTVVSDDPAMDHGAVKKKGLSDDELDVVVSRYLVQEKDVAEHAIKAMQDDGFKFGRNRFFKARDRVKQKEVKHGKN